MNRKNSILFQVSIFFIFIFLVINVIIMGQFLFDNHKDKIFRTKRYINAVKIIVDSKFNGLDNVTINKKIKHLSLELSNLEVNQFIKNGKKLSRDKFTFFEIYQYKKQKYIYLKPPKVRKNRDFQNERNSVFKKMPILLVDLQNDYKVKYFWLIVLITIDILLIWFYYFLYKKLKPLVNLKDEITKFSNGNLNINTKLKGKDEIAQVSNEFNNAIEKIRELNDSRKLFLRNILHELKTPITKGKIVSDTLEDGKKKISLQKAFSRLQYLLEEFVKIEEFSAGKLNLDRKEYRVIDLLDQALDILLIDKSKIDIYSNLTIINVDYEVFSIALKNLIDNAIKYNTNGNPGIIIKEDHMFIKNQGNPLKKEFKEYLKPFNREYESFDKGLGLGLYITNSIIEKHGFKLYYNYSDGYHILKIQFKLDED